MPKLTLIPALLLLAPTAGQAITCEALQAQIEAKVRASGVTEFALTTVDAEATAPGRVAGQCDRGGRKMVYRRAGAPARTAADTILNECKHGSVSMGGSCPK